MKSGFTLEVRAPFLWKALLDFLALRAIENVERVDDKYERSVSINGVNGRLIVDSSGDGRLPIQLLLTGSRQLPAAVERIRTMLDLDADIERIESQLSLDRCLAPMIAKNSGLRVPGSWDPFELSVRAIVGQQISVVAARTVLGRLCAAHGAKLSDSAGEAVPGCSRLFPTAEQLAEADLSAIGLTGARSRTLSAFAKSVALGELVMDVSGDPEAVIRELMTVRGIGVWTANYIAMRALKYADAFPSGDSALLAAARALDIADTHRTLDKAANRWRPWRSYAAMHLWRSLQMNRTA